MTEMNNIAHLDLEIFDPYIMSLYLGRLSGVRSSRAGGG